MVYNYEYQVRKEYLKELIKKVPIWESALPFTVSASTFVVNFNSVFNTGISTKTKVPNALERMIKIVEDKLKEMGKLP